MCPRTLIRLLGQMRPVACGLLCVAVLSGSPAWAKSETKKERQDGSKNMVAGRDPVGFPDARELYRPRRPMTPQEGSEILQELGAILEQDRVWSQALWRPLDRMKGARLQDGQADSLLALAEMIALSPDQEPKPVETAVQRRIALADRHYRARGFDSAAIAFRQSLADHPAHWDAINNLALTEMHRNNDLAALFLLGALRKNNPRYAGAAINLSVCLERLGLGGQAHVAAERTAVEWRTNPMAQYNHAWFQLSRDNPNEARRALSAIWIQDLDYPEATRLAVLADYVSGQGISATDLSLFPSAQIHRTTINGRPLRRLVPAYERRTSTTALSASTTTSGGPGRDPKSMDGTWSEKWGGVNNEKNITIRQVDGKPKVSMLGAIVRDERFDGQTLTFQVEGVSTGWKFFYTVTRNKDRLRLVVLRKHDQARFEGWLY
jgi:tetratricopeptide (TPR) repeat protein